MSPRESIYLDLVRALAALAVVIDHAPGLFDMPSVPRWGHQAVIVFFVISGYVISQVVDTRETSARSFVIARLARLWSVLVPAIFLTIACDWAGMAFGHNPWAYASVPHDWPLVRIFAVIAFVSESWISIQPFSDGVVWSLCAEFWYYILFGIWTFVYGRRRYTALLAAALLSGHKALLLLPIWLFGVALQRSRTLRRFGPKADALAFWIGLAAIIIALAARVYDLPITLMQQAVSPWVFKQLAQARVFWFDWIFGLIVAIHLFGARRFANAVPLERIAGPVKWAAGVSFAAYLFHSPLLHLSAAFLPRSQGWAAVALTLICIGVLGPPAERSKRWWRQTIGQAISRWWGSALQSRRLVRRAYSHPETSRCQAIVPPTLKSRAE